MDAPTFEIAAALLDGTFLPRLRSGTPGVSVSKGELMYLIGGVFEGEGEVVGCTSNMYPYTRYNQILF